MFIIKSWVPKSLKVYRIGLLLLFLVVFVGCDMLTTTKRVTVERSPETGTIIGNALYTAETEYQGSIDHGGILLSIEETDGLETSALTASSPNGIVTNADGSFRIEDVETGFYTVYATSPYSEEGAVSTIIEVTANEESDAGYLHLTPLGNVSGRVRVNGNAPDMDDLFIFIPGTSFSSKVQEDGTFEIRGVPALRGYPLLLRRGEALGDPSVTVLVTPGENELENVLEMTASQLSTSVQEAEPEQPSTTPDEAEDQEPTTPDDSEQPEPTPPEETEDPAQSEPSEDTQENDGTGETTNPSQEQSESLVWRGPLSTPPSSPQNNWAYFDTGDKLIYVYDGSSWVPLGGNEEIPAVWSVDLALPTELASRVDATEGVTANFVVLDDEGGTVGLTPVATGGVTPISVAGNLDDTGDLYLFIDENGDGEASWLREPVVFLGRYEMWREVTVNRDLLTLTGTAPTFSDAGSSSSLTVEIRWKEPRITQWASVDNRDLDGDGKALDYQSWVPADTEVSVALRSRSGAPGSLQDAEWISSLGEAVEIVPFRRYWSDHVVYRPESRGLEILLIDRDAAGESNNTTPGYRPVAEHVRDVLDSAGMAHTTVDAAELGDVDLDRFSAAVFVTEFIWAVPTSALEDLKDRVADGMGVLFAKRGSTTSASFFELIGVTSHNGFESGNGTSSLEFTEEWLPGLDGLTLPAAQTVYSYIDYEVATTANERAGIPQKLTTEPDRPALAWRHGYGNGRVFFWNTDLTEYAQMRGFLLHSILDVLPLGAAPIANAGVFHIDDYPAAVTAESLEPVASEYESAQGGPMPVHEFYREKWLPDMLEIARNRGMRYLFAIPFNYNTAVTPQKNGNWSFSEWERLETREDPGEPFGVTEARKIRQAGHELSLHGYNHRSLIGDTSNSDESNYWLGSGTTATMRSSVDAARARWFSDNLGPLPVTYIAPNNRIDATGLQVLSEGFPELKIFASDITVPFDLGGRISFGTDPVNPHFFALPRWTSGFNNSNQTKLYAVSQLAFQGTWTHFVHPDDIFSNPTRYPDTDPAWLRNPQDYPWGGRDSSEYGLYDELRSLLDWNRDNYPWLEWLSTVQAVERIQDSLDTEVYWEYDLHRQTLTGTFEGEPRYLWARLSGSRTLDENNLQGATIRWKREDSSRGHSLYLLHAQNNVVQLPYIEN